MIPIELETFQMLHPSFHTKRERKKLIPRIGLRSSLQLGKTLNGWELIRGHGRS